MAPAPSTTPSVPIGSETGITARIETRLVVGLWRIRSMSVRERQVGEVRAQNHEPRRAAGEGLDELLGARDSPDEVRVRA